MRISLVNTHDNELVDISSIMRKAFIRRAFKAIKSIKQRKSKWKI